MPICESAHPARPASPDPRPKAQVSTRAVGTPTQAAIARFCVTPRTKSPRRVRVRSNAIAPTTTAAKAMMTTRLQGSTTPVRISMPPDMNAGFSTCTFCAPKTVRTPWISTRLMPQVASSVSSGRP